jgi:hypothetical protein
VKALRVRQSGADPKPPQAAAVKRRGGERCGNVGTMIPAGKVERGERKQSDGQWSPTEARKLESELVSIRDEFRRRPPIPLSSDWQKQVMKNSGHRIGASLRLLLRR